MPSRLGKPQTSLVCSHCFGNSVPSFLYLVKQTDYLMTRVRDKDCVNSNENVLLLCGKLVEVIYGESGKEKERIHLDPTIGNYGCVIPPGAWHTVEVLEPSVIYEAKDGKYGEDGSETFDAFKAKVAEDKTAPTFSNSFGDLRKNIEYLIGMERQSGRMDEITPLYVSRMLNVPLEEVEEVMKEL